VATVPEGGRADIDRAVAAAVAAQESGRWGRAPLDVRAAALARLAEVYEARKDEIAGAMSTEMGCPRAHVAAMHVDPAARALRYYTGLAATYPFTERREGARANRGPPPPRRGLRGDRAVERAGVPQHAQGGSGTRRGLRGSCSSPRQKRR